ncbi:MAG: DNA topoisomerase IB [Flavipsychrobacter sp.]|nr:DNA topoisomerase IB [Flavipsychrobacter sp.]
MEVVTEIKLTKRTLKTLVYDPVKSAEAINLIYMPDTVPGIERIQDGASFKYLKDGVRVSDEDMGRIKSLVIPPAWKNVWISPFPNGHLQATGTDIKNRKQYKYHPLWNTLRNHTKFYHLLEFGKALPAMRQQLQKDMQQSGLPLQKVLATIVSIMQCTCIRIGNSIYEKLYGSFGLTTLKDKHVKISGNELKFAFKGKKGVHHDISLKSRKLARIVQQCRDIPGHELFQYYTETGDRHPIDSGMVNNYIKQIGGGNFTAKDFRTWAGSLHAIEAFKELGESNTVTEAKKNIIIALDMVASQLGNTRTVCRKYYVHPFVINHYANNTMSRYFSKFDKITCPNDTGLSPEEHILMQMLEDGGNTVIAA